MDPSGIWILILGLGFCVLFSGFFSASETAFLSLSRIRLKTLADGGDERARLALRLHEESDRLISCILIGNNIVNIAGTAIATVLFTHWLGGSMGPTASTVVMTLLVLLFGEISPKQIAKDRADRIAMAFAPHLKRLMALLTPVDWLLSAWRRLLKRLFKPQEVETPIEEELITMVNEAQHEGDMDAREGALIRSAIEFDDLDALSIMTPRVDVTALEDTDSMAEAERVFRESGYSRLPVYHEDLDHMVGVLHEKDFYRAQHRGIQDIKAVMVPPVYAPSTLNLSKLLKLCQTTRTHMVIVLDEFGGTEGIVTIEDVLEELVGEIYDEHDDVSEDVVTLEDGSIQVDGGMQLAELLERLGMEDTYEADTVGGWAAEELGQIPETGMGFTAGPYEVKVTAMDRRRVTKVNVTRREEPAEADGERG
ncbi:MAG: HlyC/CorC family transporter [Clostridia bacterium]|nr:HlyC/CorC family transporter [Clostridia bacterium]